MKILKNTALFFLVPLAIACGGGGDDAPLAPEKNSSPQKIAELVYPTNNLLCIDNTLNFEWQASSDPNGDAITYQLEIATESTFSDLKIYMSTTNTKIVTLEKEKAYYWRVKAIDSQELAGEYSNTFQFYTEGVGAINHLPFSPELVAPKKGENLSETEVVLEWNGSDVDKDPLRYDVYFGTVNPPVTKIGEEQSEKTKRVTVTASTTYFWKVVVKDGNGGEAIGQIWDFSID